MIASAAESTSSNGMPSWGAIVANLAAGATAGCAVEAALYPIDTIKTRLQAMIGGGGMKALLQSGGGKGLYAGVWGNLVGVAPSSAIFMAFYEPVKQAVHKAVSEDQQYLGPVVAGERMHTRCALAAWLLQFSQDPGTTPDSLSAGSLCRCM
jgi:solute carrier family 25 S-adenosylmethionine transporter 26